MSKTARFLASLFLSAFALVAVGVLSSCDEGNEDVAYLTVSPSIVTLSVGTNLVTFTVNSNSLRQLSLPLEWRVENGDLGRIVAASGHSALYEATKASEEEVRVGVNIVTVKDQYDAQGFATVDQIEVAVELILVADQIDDDQWLIRVVNSKADETFEWWAEDVTVGEVVHLQGAAAEFTLNEADETTVVHARSLTDRDREGTIVMPPAELDAEAAE